MKKPRECAWLFQEKIKTSGYFPRKISNQLLFFGLADSCAGFAFGCGPDLHHETHDFLLSHGPAPFARLVEMTVGDPSLPTFRFKIFCLAGPGQRCS